MVTETDNAIIKVSNNIVIHGSQRQCFFHKTKVVRLEKREICSCFEFSQHSPRHEAQVKNRATTLTIAFPQINCNLKESYNYRL